MVEASSSPSPLHPVDPEDHHQEATWFAGGGLGLSIIALGLALAHIKLASIDAQPLVLVMLMLSVPLGIGGACWGGLTFFRQRQKLGLAAVIVTVFHLFGIMSWGVPYSLGRYRAQQLVVREKAGLELLSRLRMAAVSYRQDHGGFRFLNQQSSWTPSRPPSSRRYMYQKDIWVEEPWKTLGFAPYAAHFHQLRYRSVDDGRGFVVQARGDLDEDGQLATYTSTVWLKGDGEVTSKPVQYWPHGAK